MMTPATTLHSWIHHGSQSDSKSYSSTKSQVFRHVAAHRKLKRQQRTLKLRASALDALKTLQMPCKHLPCVDNHLTGSGDPFDTIPIPLTPEMKDLLHFDRTYLSPALSRSKIPAHPSSLYLQDDLAAYGYLACIAAIKSRCCEDASAFNVMLKLKVEAMEKLRLKLPQMAPNRLPLAVMALLYTETWCRNIEAVAVHVRLLEVINEHHGLDVDDLICILHSDVQRAALTLDTTIFVMEDRSWDVLEAEYVPSLEAGREMKVVLQDSLRQLHFQMRETLVALDLLQAPEISRPVRQAATIKCLHVMSLLLDHYNLSSDTIEKYTALAALYRIRRAASMERISLYAITIFDAGMVLIPTLRKLLVAASNDPPHLRLWALSVGMMSGDSWFKKEFEQQVDDLALWNPKDLRRILNGFEHRDFPRPSRLLLNHGLEDGKVDMAEKA